jgi:hypothetical protein
VLKYIIRLLPPNYLRLPLLGLFLIVGMIADRAKPVSSNQIDADPYSYRVVIPDSGAVVETWKEQTDVAQESQPVPVAKLEKQPLITALIPDPQTPTNKSGVAPDSSFPKEDGIYLYGQSSQPGQVGQGYVVFQKQQGRVTGALYMPHSEYSCFNGTVDNSGELAMTVDGYAGDGSSAQVASNNNIPNVKEDEPENYAYSLALRDFHRLDNVSVTDRSLLQKCQGGGNRE